MAASYHSLVIVGAGAAGLYAAQLLRPQFPDLLVVEAQDRIGGRIKQVRHTDMACLQNRALQGVPFPSPSGARPGALGD